MTAEDRFGITERPDRRFPSAGGMEYEGGTVFVCEPTRPADTRPLRDLVLAVLGDGPYRYGDFHDLPMPLWLVRDRETGDTFRVAVREDSVRLHVLPRTESAGLRRFFERLADRSDAEWATSRLVEGPAD